MIALWDFLFRESEEKKSLFDTIFSTEGSVEKQLRETGEWITDKTEDKFRSAGILYSSLNMKIF